MGCAASRDAAPNEASSVPTGLAPFQAFSALLGRKNAGALRRCELERCLVAIGMRKSVLMLALDPLGDTGAEDRVTLRMWWDALNPRSKVVIESKLRSFTSIATLLSLASVACGSALGSELMINDVTVLSTTLQEIGAEAETVSALMERSNTKGSLGSWFKDLSPADASSVRGWVGFEEQAVFESSQSV
jgi:hypothetical protein